MPVGLPWGGYVETDLLTTEFFDQDHTLSLYVMPQFPYAYDGPFLTTRDVDWLSVGQATFLPTIGACPAGGTHTGGAHSPHPWRTYLVEVERAHPKAEAGWLRCDGCRTLVAGAAGGPCAAGGAHDLAGSPAYKVLRDLTHAELTAIHGEPGWRRCGTCRGLFSPASGTATCPAGGAHDQAGGADYALRLPPVDTEIGLQAHWLNCVNCGGLHFGGMDTRLRVRLGDLTRNVAVPMRRRAWHHVALVRAGGQVQLYVDGRPKGAPLPAPTDPTPAADLRLGRTEAARPQSTEQFYGLIDDLAIFLRALGPAELANLAQRTTLLTGLEPGLHAVLPLSPETFPPPFNRPIKLGGGAVLVGGNGPRDTVADGDLFPPSNPTVPLRLPFPAGQAWECIQSVDDAIGSHRGVFSFCHDFVVAQGPTEGAPFTAPASGVAVEATWSGMPGEGNLTNLVALQSSADELFAGLHYRFGSARVGVGEVVAAGRALALGGNTGTGGAHLHTDTHNPARRTIAAVYTGYEVSRDQGVTWTAVPAGIPALGEWVRNPVSVSASADWRRCRRCRSLFRVGSGASVCPATGAHDATGSSDYTLVTDGAGQAGWRWCRRCGALFFSLATPGTCPAGATHDATGSGNYTLVQHGAGGQAGWRLCSRCEVLFLGPGPGGACALGGSHDGSGSGDFTVLDREGTRPFVQVGWRRCQDCRGLYLGPGEKGVCPAGGRHDPGAEPQAPRYEVVRDFPGGPGQTGWRLCAKCGGLFFGLSPTTGTCPAGGGHDVAGDANYQLMRYSNLAGEVAWRRCLDCEGLYLGPGGDGGCPAGGTHTPPPHAEAYHFDPIQPSG